MQKNPLVTFYQLLRYRLNLDDDRASDLEIISNLKKGVEFKGTNLWTLIFAIFIASIGLDVNSTAVIIGAMLISPLMGPIMGIGLGAGIYDFALIKRAAKNLLIATTIALSTSTFYFFVSPLHQAQSELLARTSPTIWDVLIAFIGGAAGIVASSRKHYNNIIPGVAIATALMPPLCTAGFGLANLEWAYFFGAFYLYVINSVFISIATFLVVRFLKIHPASQIDAMTSKKIKKWVGILAFLTIAPSCYLAYHFVKNEFFIQHANRLISEELSQKGMLVLHKKINPKTNEILVTLLTNYRNDSIEGVLNAKKNEYKLQNSSIIVNQKELNSDDLSRAEQVRINMVENLFKVQHQQLDQLSNDLNELKASNRSSLSFLEKKESCYKEYQSLFGTPQEMIIEKTDVLLEEGAKDTVIVVVLKPIKKPTTAELKKINAWLSTKFEPHSVKLILNQ